MPETAARLGIAKSAMRLGDYMSDKYMGSSQGHRAVLRAYMHYMFIDSSQTCFVVVRAV